MPARIDPEKRRQQVVEAAFRLVVAEGVAGVSMRKVADESGLNIGSVRHYFNDHRDLLTAAAEEAGNRMGARLAEHLVETLRGLRDDAALDALQSLAEAVLPVDELRRGEATVVLELISASRTMPVFHAMAERMATDLTAVLHDALEALDVPEPELAAGQISAMIGGLTLDALTPHGSLSIGRMREIMRSHLSLLLTQQRRPRAIR